MKVKYRQVVVIAKMNRSGRLKNAGRDNTWGLMIRPSHELIVSVAGECGFNPTDCLKLAALLRENLAVRA